MLSADGGPGFNETLQKGRELLVDPIALPCEGKHTHFFLLLCLVGGWRTGFAVAHLSARKPSDQRGGHEEDWRNATDYLYGFRNPSQCRSGFAAIRH